MNNEQELIGQLFINTSKDGKTTYLRGHVNGQKVVCFLNTKTGESYRVLSDTRTDEAPKAAPAAGGYSKGGYNKGGYSKGNYSAKPTYSKPKPEDAPF